MKELLCTIATIFFVTFCLVLVFIMQGEPSLWDVWQQAAKGVCK